MPSRVLRVSNMLFSPLRFRSRSVGCPRGSLPPSSPVLHGYFICTDTAHPVHLQIFSWQPLKAYRYVRWGNLACPTKLSDMIVKSRLTASVWVGLVSSGHF